MFLSRLGTRPCLRNEFLKRTAITTVPRLLVKPCHVRSFKTTVKLFQEEVVNAVKVRANIYIISRKRKITTFLYTCISLK